MAPWPDAERLAPPEAQAPVDRRAVVEAPAQLYAATPHVVGIATADDDGLHLVDWDTARLAPQSRDLWPVTGAEEGAAEARAVQPPARRRCRLRDRMGRLH